MEDLLEALRSEVLKLAQGPLVEDGDWHLELCVWLSERFELSDADDGFPLWLSRVVAGELEDFRNSEGFWFVEDGEREGRGLPGAPKSGRKSPDPKPLTRKDITAALMILNCRGGRGDVVRINWTAGTFRMRSPHMHDSAPMRFSVDGRTVRARRHQLTIK